MKKMVLAGMALLVSLVLLTVSCHKEKVTNNQNNTDYSHTDSFFPSAYAAPGKTEGMTERDKIKHQIEYDCLRFRCNEAGQFFRIYLEPVLPCVHRDKDRAAQPYYTFVENESG